MIINEFCPLTTYFNTSPPYRKVYFLFNIKYMLLSSLGSQTAHLMGRHWSRYIEALFHVRHANVDIEVSERTCTFNHFELCPEAATCSSLGHHLKDHVTYLMYHIGSASLVIFSFAFMIFFICKNRRLYFTWRSRCDTHTHTHVWVVFYLHVDEIVERVDVLLHQPFHLQNRWN